jgi:hypothetical protein
MGGGSNFHTHLRLTPELGKITDGPKNGTEPPVTGTRHPVFKGFDKTDIIPFGGMLESVNTDPGAQVLLTFIPVCPTMPPEDAWMRVKKTDIQGLILNTTSKGSRIAFMPADIDRQFARNNYSDHGDLLANIIRWTSKDNIPLLIEGAGLVDCNLYHQRGRLILHIMNLIMQEHGVTGRRIYPNRTFKCQLNYQRCVGEEYQNACFRTEGHYFCKKWLVPVQGQFNFKP